jgi:hypothetical protein
MKKQHEARENRPTKKDRKIKGHEDFLGDRRSLSSCPQYSRQRIQRAIPRKTRTTRKPADEKKTEKLGTIEVLAIQETAKRAPEKS